MSEELHIEDLEKMAKEIKEIEKALLEKTVYSNRGRIIVVTSSLSLAKTVIEQVLEEKPSYNGLDIKELEDLQELISNSLYSIGYKIINYKKENLHELVARFNNKGFDRS